MRPVPGRVTQPYWAASPSYAGGRHRGIDFAAPLGTPVAAPWSGVVTAASWGPAYGRHVVIDFDKLPDGSPGYWGVLAHLSSKAVEPGERVTAGQVVGLSGDTGNSIGPHLHFEVQSGPTWRPASHIPETSRDPQPWIDAQVEVEKIYDGFGLWKWYSGKPKGDLVLHPGTWVRTGLKEPASGIKVESSEHRLLYLRVELPTPRTAERVLEVKFVRANGDATAYDSEEYGLKADSHPYCNVHFEDGDGGGGEWWVKVTGGDDPITLTTRYAKQHTFYEKPQ